MVGAELREAGYSQVDGLDPSQGYLNGAAARGIFRLELQTKDREDFTITEKAPTRAFFWFNAPSLWLLSHFLSHFRQY